MKYFVCSDIHGDWKAFQKSIKACQYDKDNSNHQLIVIGDLFGRATDSSQDILNLYYYLTKDVHVNTPIIIHGNHENILEIAMKRGYCDSLDVYNGEDKTVAALGGVTRYEARTHYGVQQAWEQHPEFVHWLESLPHYYETENFIFTHGTLPLLWNNLDDADEIVDDWRKADAIDWVVAEWAETDEWIDKVERCNCVDRLLNGKTLVFGHWGTFLLRGIEDNIQPARGDCDIWFSADGHYIGLDGTTALSHQVNMLVIDETNGEECVVEVYPFNHTVIDTVSVDDLNSDTICEEI